MADIAQILLFVSGKGGVGKSSVASAIACALAARGKRVLILDMDIGLKSLEALFGIGDSVVYNWGDVLEERCTLPSAVRSARGADILPAPLRPASAFTPDRFRQMLAGCAPQYDFILLDAPSGLGKNIELSVCAATAAIIVATPDRISASAAGECAVELARLAVPTVRLAANRFSARTVRRGYALNLDEMIDLCAARLIGVIPEDREFSLCASNGLPFTRTEAFQAADRMAGRILGEEIPLKHLEKFGNN